MTYTEAIDFLFSSLPVWERLGVGAYKPGLERIGAFAAALGNPQERLRTVHVAGTNGKGSTCHMLAAVLQSAGLRTGLFTSPHLTDFRERIRVDGEMIPEEAVAEFTERWRGRMEGLSFFEMATGMGLWWFAEAGCDVAVVETGLGGRLDSTNIVRPVLSVITNIGLEHTQYLGTTVAAIAAEKAGIIKPRVPVVVGETDPESAPVFRARAVLAGSAITFADAPRGANTCAAPSADDERNADGGSVAASDYALDLAGDYQQKNVRTVLAAVDALRGAGMAIPETAVREGLANAARLTGLQGRWQVVGREPLTVLDTAHNAHGLALVARQIARQRYERLFMVLGVAGDKDVESIVPLLPADAHYILTCAASPRSMPPRELARRLTRGAIPSANAECASGPPPAVRTETTHAVATAAETFAAARAGNAAIAPANVETAETVSAAIRRARELATPRDMIFIGGSNFIVAEALAEY